MSYSESLFDGLGNLVDVHAAGTGIENVLVDTSDPLADGSVAVAFYNLSGDDLNGELSIDFGTIAGALGNKMKSADEFIGASEYTVTDLWTGESEIYQTLDSDVFTVSMEDGALRIDLNENTRIYMHMYEYAGKQYGITGIFMSLDGQMYMAAAVRQ